ncbi:MAG TPA: UDP-N-acetylmuramoyl-L-alanine--D-glutamate ligase [Candidatus Moranbacteria bacterium]|nr:UDP-N-acetylmuramoyl-L-alanine--D-glutamate ligase [Candidatus Moranbacteria bacterium]
MKIGDLKDKKITVMGLGLHGGGIGTARFLSELGAQVTVTDIKSKEELAPALEKLKGCKNITYVFNQHRPEDFTAVDMVVKTPAAPWNNKYIKLALDNKIPVEVDSSLFFKLCKNTIIGVTGTKGKTTTATLIYEILKNSGKNVIKVGIGQVSVLDKLKEIKKDTIAVFELSSWRLSALGRYGLSPQIAVITNVYPDHLNYYKTMEEYVADKKLIFKNQKNGDVCVINFDDEVIKTWESDIKSQVIKISRQKIDKGKGSYASDGMIYLNDGNDENKIMEEKEIKIKGDHNVSNVLLAMGASQAAGIGLEDIKKAVSQFKGIAHRLEFVRELNGVKYYNDTTATTPESAISGISSFSEPVILIGGGSDKNLDMKDLAKVILEKTKGVIFLKGQGTDKIISEIKKNLPEEEKNKEFATADSLEKAVEMAKGDAESGDIVLLSPGAASFGLFNNEFDRGDKFKEVVKALK